MIELDTRGDAPEQVRPGDQVLCPEFEAEKPPVSEHQHPGSHRGQQSAGQLAFPVVDRAEHGRHHRVGAAFSQADRMNLGKRSPCAALIFAEFFQISV